jgi:hypothetical protein
VSTFARREIRCPCGAAMSVDVADSVHAVTAPRLRAAILDRTFHVFTCEQCGERRRLDKALAYTDFARHQWLLVFPPEQLADYRAIDAAARASFQATMVERCAPIVREWSADMKRRTVFGLASLREKLVTFDLGLDDRVIELIKLRQAVQHGLPAVASIELASRTGDSLLLDVATPGAPVARLAVAGAAYARLAGLGRDLDAAAAPVQHGDVVDWRIAMVEPAALAASEAP